MQLDRGDQLLRRRGRRALEANQPVVSARWSGGEGDNVNVMLMPREVESRGWVTGELHDMQIR